MKKMLLFIMMGTALGFSLSSYVMNNAAARRKMDKVINNALDSAEEISNNMKKSMKK